MRQPLAIDGGPALIPGGPPSWPLADQDILDALEKTYADGSWGRYHGPHCERLVDLLRTMHDCEHAWLCSSGTIAVELALRGLKIGSGDEVVLAGYDFPGNFRSIEAVGARPVLVDIDPATWCLDVADVERAIGPATKAVIASHLHGGTAAMNALCELAARRGLHVVEDACQAPGAMVHGRVAGTWGDVGILSFGGSKLLTAGRGGAVLTNQADVYQRLKIFAERGNDAFPLSELQALVLPPQLNKLPERNRIRRHAAQRLIKASCPWQALQPVAAALPEDEPCYYKLAWLYEPDDLGGRPREAFLAAVQAEGVAVDAGFRGFVRRSSRRSRIVGGLSHSARAANDTVLLHHPVLLEPQETIDRVADALSKVCEAWRRRDQE